ncbi:homeobox protein Hox-C11 isoform X2 [Pleurodeles waltl]|uniref:homeobox protein Hox-C11 isoform X2 n=1 Tax=Pleurodeles waltl TaxID=8319 RepID=UPI0037094A3D
MFNSVNLSNFCSQPRKERSAEYGERSGLYLPSCTYYVPEFSGVPSFLPQAPSRQISYPYSTGLPQPGREVPYGLDPGSKWHPRSGYAPCYPAAEELLPPSGVGEVLLKSEGVYGAPHHPHHPHHHHHPPGGAFYKNSVLPQGFDRFFDNAYCGGPDPPAADEDCAPKAADPPQPAAAPDPEDEEDPSNPGSSASPSPAHKDGSKGSASSRCPTHEEEAVSLFQVPDQRAGARVFLQCVH